MVYLAGKHRRIFYMLNFVIDEYEIKGRTCNRYEFRIVQS